MATFPERLKMLRDRANLTQQQLADMLGFSVGAVGNWESGLNMPTRKSMRKIATILGTTELFLSGESDIDTLIAAEEGADYAGALPFSKMTDQELQFIFDSRQRELTETQDSRRKHELFALIAEVSSELAKRAMKAGEKPDVSSKNAVDDEVKRAVKETLPKPAPK